MSLLQTLPYVLNNICMQNEYEFTEHVNNEWKGVENCIRKRNI